MNLRFAFFLFIYPVLFACIAKKSVKEPTLCTIIKSVQLDGAAEDSIKKEPVNFTTAYINNHKGNWTVDVPEVQELVLIIMALTIRGQNDNIMVEHNSPYYQEVMAHFNKYKLEPVVFELNKLLSKDLYSQLKMDACSFVFNNAKIKKDSIYDRMSWGDYNTLDSLVEQLEYFALKSGFKEFYKNHIPYYESLKKEVSKYMPVDKQWKWLEKQFPIKYDSYRITFSPLVNGSHSTNYFSGNGFSQTIMFVCPTRNYAGNDKVKEGLNSRIIFTEIDHNYVNPLSNKYILEIESEFVNKEKWISGIGAANYDTPYALFNEYMTWAVFTLYCRDMFNEEDFKVIMDHTTKLIVERRGFLRFQQFSDKLLSLNYQQGENKNVVDLYPEILKWCKNVHF